MAILDQFLKGIMFLFFSYVLPPLIFIHSLDVRVKSMEKIWDL